MPANISPLAQEDVRQALDRALGSERGVRITFSTGTPEANSAMATYTRARMHKLRAQDRRHNREIYQEDHPMHNTSAWDGIIIQKIDNKDGSSELRMSKSDLSKFNLEEL